MTTPSKASQRMVPVDALTETEAADEAVSLAYWLAEQMGEHVDDQDGETLTETVQRVLLDAQAKAYDEAVAMCCEFLGVPNVNWPNPYRETKHVPVTTEGTR